MYQFSAINELKCGRNIALNSNFREELQDEQKKNNKESK